MAELYHCNAMSNRDTEALEDNELVTLIMSSAAQTPPTPPRGPWYIFNEANFHRQLWNVILMLLLAYMGTIFPYRLCFVDMKLDGSTSDSTFWRIVETIVDILFVIDLVAWFFFTYRDNTGKEVYDMKRIACHYLTGYFVLNLFACIPPQLTKAIVNAASGKHETNVTKIARFTRVQRLSKLVAEGLGIARLVMALKLFKGIDWFHFVGTRIATWFANAWYIRILNLVVALVWTVHLLACGWYVVAYFHDDHDRTWVARRDILGASSFDQWLQANYYVLAVFTTVGFGDIYAVTKAEAIYTCFTMIIGTLMQSIITGEVINIVTHADQSALDMKAQKELVKSFAEHADVHPALTNRLLKYIETIRSHRHRIDRDDARVLLTSNDLPRDLMAALSDGLFKGELVHNNFITTCARHRRKMPHRFPLLIALMLNEKTYHEHELVYIADDYPWTLFLVVAGYFAYVAYPTLEGGLKHPPPDATALLNHLDSKKFEENNSHGWNGAHSRGFHMKFHQTHSETAHYRAQKEASKHLVDKLFPFQLFGPRNYFGDLELLLANEKKRFCTARCEPREYGHVGRLLEMAREDLKKLMSEFGLCGHVWRKRARRRDEQRKFALWRLQGAKGNENKLTSFAALTIQRYWKYRHGTDPDREAFIVRALTNNVGKSNSGASLADHIVEDEIKEDVKRMQAAVASFEETKQDVKDVQEKVASIEKQMVALTDLLSLHLGVRNVGRETTEAI